MRRLSYLAVFTWALGLLTVVVLLANVPETSTIDVSVWVFYAGLVALMLNLGTMLNEGVISPASTAALMALLTVGGYDSADSALWCVTVGALVGNLVWLLRTLPTGPLHRQYTRVIRSIMTDIAQMTLGLVVGAWAYGRLGGALPLTRLATRDITPLFGLIIAYLAVYLGILFLDAYLVRQWTPRKVVDHWYGGMGVVLLPLPFAIVGAVVYHELSRLAFIILISGLLIITTGVNLISRTQGRYKQQVRELSALSAVSRAMRTSDDLNTVLAVVYAQVSHLLEVDNFTVALIDPNRSLVHFPFNVVRGRVVPTESREPGNGLIEHVIREQRPLLIAENVPRRAARMGLTLPPAPVHSWMGVPLLAPERVLGCIAVYATQPSRQFTQNDLELLITIVGQAGIAMDNALLYQQAHDRAVQLATLNNVSAVLSGSLNVQQVLDLVASSALAVTGADAVALYLWDEGRQPPVPVRHSGVSDDFVTRQFRPLLLDIGALERRRQPVIVTDVQIDHRAADLRGAVINANKHAWVELLLRKGDDLLGMLVCFYDQPRYFAPEEVELLRNFSNQAALAVSNASLYTRTDEALNRRVEQLSALADISRELTSTLNVQGVFQLVLNRAIDATHSCAGLLLLRPENGSGSPRVVAHQGFGDEWLEHDDPLTGYIAQTYDTGMPSVVPDMWDEQAGRPISDAIRSQLNVPIMRGEQVLGVISLGSDRPDAYSPDELSFVTQLAQQAAIAIDNARLFRRIEEARDRLQVILDSMREGVILIGADGWVSLANPRVEKLLGLPPRQITERPVLELLRDPHLAFAERIGSSADALAYMVQSLEAGSWEEPSRGDSRVSFEVVTPKRRFIDRTDTPVRDETGRTIGVLMVFADVTEERELAQAREDLSSMIVHDLRGPLTAITTSLKLLDEIAPADDPLGKAVRQITEASLQAVRKLLNLVDSLLDISKLESGIIGLNRDLVDLAPLCQSAVDELSPLAQELDVLLTIELPDDLPTLDIDPEKIERVLLNLVDNAIKFTPAGGHVTVRASVPDSLEPAEVVRVEVRDTGPGVPDEHKERLFDRFAQIQGMAARRRGTGLGLTFCRLAVEAHGGEIWIEDNPDGGAVFVFTLPIARMLSPDFIADDDV